MSELDRDSPSRPEQVRLSLIVYPLLLRRDPEVWAELRLPRDLTAAEAERVARYVRTLAIDAPIENPMTRTTKEADRG